MNATFWWGASAVVLALILIGSWRNAREAKKDEDQREKVRQEQWVKTKKRWHEIHALYKVWETIQGTGDAIDFWAWMEEYKVSQYELNHIYWEHDFSNEANPGKIG